jgi:hypothetical protein
VSEGNTICSRLLCATKRNTWPVTSMVCHKDRAFARVVPTILLTGSCVLCLQPHCHDPQDSAPGEDSGVCKLTGCNSTCQHQPAVTALAQHCQALTSKACNIRSGAVIHVLIVTEYRCWQPSTWDAICTQGRSALRTNTDGQQTLSLCRTWSCRATAA